MCFISETVIKLSPDRDTEAHGGNDREAVVGKGWLAQRMALLK
ncbi:hypothetical protein [uncultured Shimia sp.]|nr:hypothetical protein [uncultured Shimia sp.]